MLKMRRRIAGAHNNPGELKRSKRSDKSQKALAELVNRELPISFEHV